MKLKYAAIGTLVATFAPAHAQMPNWSPEQEAVWDYVAESWEDDVTENGEWPAEYVLDSSVGWSASGIIPRGKDAWIEWSRFGDESNTTLKYELLPLAIATEGDTAVVNYIARTVSEDDDGERETSTLGITETLVRVEGSWKYLASTDFTFSMNDD